jgi:hypothetical protein
VLVSAVYDAGEATVTLGFDRAVTLDSGAPFTLTLVDGPGGQLYNGSSAGRLADPVTVVVDLIFVDVASGPDVVMDAPAPTGVGGDPDGVPWGGVSGLVLPFP